MDPFRRSPRPSAPLPELRPPRSMWWWALPAALLVGAAVWGVSAWLLQDLGTLPVPEQVSARIEAVRTSLAAGAGVGAAMTLLLAVRRQRHQELATAHTTHDAAERRVTELYTKAAEQLGNAQAPVRLAGLYALERLAQDTPVLRQTIVDVICSYLRMPYTPPDGTDPAGPAVPRATVAGVSAPATGHDPQEERQVRLTAQRILTAHLHYDDSSAPRRRWPSRHPDRNPRHWPDIQLDLTGAVLIDFDLRTCRMGTAEFGGAAFSGTARFDGAAFSGTAWFDGATFSRDARFEGATFSGDAMFRVATFSGTAVFDGATFTRYAVFSVATFSRAAWFDGATFSRDARFDRATFSRDARFAKATFSGDARFDEASGLETAELTGVRIAPVAAYVRRVWPPCWRVEVTAEGWQTLRVVAAGDGGGQAADGEAGPAG
ncbi:pentapeptide repeat-containing protein [Nonomuraea sp. NPDC005692]|uniref:pentapeptide repeat-containing protein n=1 Tax=Nonomuraea sp. NPDC005692 TaxID=3157168 RepID=UPI0033EE2001